MAESMDAVLGCKFGMDGQIDNYTGGSSVAY